MAIFGLNRVDYPRKRLTFINLTKFQKYYVCVLNFLSKLVLVESLRLLEYSSTAKSEGGKTWLKVIFTKIYVVFSLISSLWALISHFFSKLTLFSRFFTGFQHLKAQFFGVSNWNWPESTYIIVRRTLVLRETPLVFAFDLYFRSLRLFSGFEPSWLALITRSKILLWIESSSSRVFGHHKIIN